MKSTNLPAATGSSKPLQCHICYDTPAWRIRAQRHPQGPTSWLICQACKALVQVGKWDLLALRKLRAWELHEDRIGGPHGIVAMRRYCAQIRRYMTSLQPIHDTD